MPAKIQIGRAHDVKPRLFESDEVRGVEKRVLIGKSNGAENFVMRLFTLSAGGHSPLHAHPWEHEVYILSGESTVFTPEGEKIAGAGSYVFVPPNVKHQFKNTGKGNLEFICVIPKTADEE